MARILILMFINKLFTKKNSVSMKQQKKWILRIAQALFCALILTACGGGDDDLSEPVTPTPPPVNPSDPTPGNNDGADAINFDPSINGMTTRGTMSNAWNADGTEQVAVQIGNEVRQYYVNEQRCMVSNNPFSWDGDFTDHAVRSVTAWYPYSATLGAERSVHANQEEDGLDSSDFLYGTSSVSYQGGGTRVYRLQFDHQISKIVFIVSNETAGDSRTVTGIQLMNTCLSGTFTAPASGSFGSWTTTAGSEATITAKAVHSRWNAIVIPQTITSGTELVTITLSDASTKTVTTPYNINLLTGKVHDFTFHIKDEGITLTTSIHDWTSEQRGNPGSWSGS